MSDETFDLKKALLERSQNFGAETKKAFNETYKKDNNRKEQYWITGWEFWDSCFPTLDFGTGFMVSPANMGKSNFAINLGRHILDHTPDSLWIDVTLDDEESQRHRCIAASTGRMHMKDITLPGLLKDEDPKRQQRRDSYQTVIRSYGSRLDIISEDSFSNQGRNADLLCAYFDLIREQHPTKKIFITIDSFADIDPGPKFDPRYHTTKEQYLSTLFKNNAIKNKIFILFTMHQVKGRRGRGMDADVTRGSGQLEYDSKLFLLLYSEVGELGQGAQLYYEREGHEDEKFPVLEVLVVKNKGGEYKKKYVYFLQEPEAYFCDEASQEDQEFFSNEVANQTGAKSKH